jgi:hypothetical protein
MASAGNRKNGAPRTGKEKQMPRQILTGDAIPIDPERVRHLARSMVALGEGMPTEQVMAALELAVGNLVRAAWIRPLDRLAIVRQFTDNVRQIARQ